MSKRENSTHRNIDEETEDREKPFDSGEFIDDILEHPPVEEKIAGWLERVNLDENSAKIYVYRMNNNRKELMNRFEGPDIPDEHSIGMMFGGGHYVIIVSVPQGAGKKHKQTSFSCMLSSHYDDMRRANAAQGITYIPPIMTGYRQAGVGNGSQQGLSGQNTAMQAFKEGMGMVVEMMSRLMPAPVQQPVQQQLPDFSGLLMNQYKSMADMMRDNLKNTDNYLVDTLKSHRKKGRDDDYPENDEPEEQVPDNPLLAAIPELIKLLPALFASPQAQPIVGQLMQQAPQVAGAVQQAATHGMNQADLALRKKAALQRQIKAKRKGPLSGAAKAAVEKKRIKEEGNLPSGGEA